MAHNSAKCAMLDDVIVAMTTVVDDDAIRQSAAEY